MRQRYAALVHVGVDWLTATCTDSSGIRALQRYGERWLQAEVKAGNDCREFGGHGYSGLACGSIQLARRYDGLMIRCTGRSAEENFKVVQRYATNFSRIDFQSTVVLRDGVNYYAEACEREALRHRRKHKLNHQVELRRNCVTGNTVYLGRRVSDRFIRIYDKGAESRLPELQGCWRAECQYNNRLAWSMANNFALNGFDEAWMHNTVHLELKRKGVTWYRPIDRSETNHFAESPKPRSTNCRRLLWLESQVKPTVQRLLDQGLESELMRALGLPNETPTKESENV